MIIMDRVPLLVGIAAVYFGFRASNWLLIVLFLAFMVIPMLATMRQRQGVAHALDYLSRVYFPDPSDEIHRDAH